jgi:hypothetical protein
MHDKINLIREALNAAQDAEIKLSGVAIIELEAVNKYLFELEEKLSQVELSLQKLCFENECNKVEIEELETELVQLGRVPHG